MEDPEQKRISLKMGFLPFQPLRRIRPYQFVNFVRCCSLDRTIILLVTLKLMG